MCMTVHRATRSVSHPAPCFAPDVAMSSQQVSSHFSTQEAWVKTKQGETRFAPILVTPTSWRRTNIHMEFKHEKNK